MWATPGRSSCIVFVSSRRARHRFISCSLKSFVERFTRTTNNYLQKFVVTACKQQNVFLFVHSHVYEINFKNLGKKISIWNQIELVKGMSPEYLLAHDLFAVEVQKHMYAWRTHTQTHIHIHTHTQAVMHTHTQSCLSIDTHRTHRRRHKYYGLLIYESIVAYVGLVSYFGIRTRIFLVCLRTSPV